MLQHDETAAFNNRAYLHHFDSQIDHADLSSHMAKLWRNLVELDRLDDKLCDEEPVHDKKLHDAWWNKTVRLNKRHRAAIEAVHCYRPRTKSDAAVKAIAIWSDFRGSIPDGPWLARHAETMLAYAGVTVRNKTTPAQQEAVHG